MNQITRKKCSSVQTGSHLFHRPEFISGSSRSNNKMLKRVQHDNSRGFTLIELLVVVLIIGILAAVALPQYNKAVKKAQGAEALVALEALDQAISHYYLENGTYEGINPDSLNVDIPELQHFRYQMGSSGGVAQSNENSKLTDEILSLCNNSECIINIGIHPTQVYISASWKNGNFKAACSVASGSYATCSDYFNCVSSPRQYTPPTQSGTNFVPPKWTGGNCNLQ